MKKTFSVILALVMCLSTFVTASAVTDKPFYLVLGDSIAYGSGLGNPTEACYGKIVADTNNYEYVNYSVPGHTTTNLIARLGQSEVVEALQKADIISISIGGNDFLMNNLYGLMYDAMVAGDLLRFDEIGKGVYKNLSVIIGKIRALNADAVILMQNLYPLLTKSIETGP